MSIYLATFGKLRYLGLAEIPDPAVSETRWILIKTVRGLEMGLVGGALSQEQEAKYRASCLEDNSGEQTRGPEPMLQEVEYVRNADAEQIEAYYQCRSDEDAALVRGREILAGHDLTMKLVDVEYLMDRKKLFFYFTSEQRVDFRGYVRDLAKEFRTRIEMRQIGVRDEARVVRGIAPCGRPCCCSYWLHRFTPICIRMVKEQNLALNPTKISGICGRLMCCMAYEHPLYSALWKSLPSPGAKIRTENGTYVLDSVDLASESVRVRFPNGHLVPVSIAEFPDFREAVLQGRDWGGETVAVSVGSGLVVLVLLSDDGIDVEVLRTEPIEDADQDVGHLDGNALGLVFLVDVDHRFVVPVLLKGLGELGVAESDDFPEAPLFVVPAVIYCVLMDLPGQLV